MLVQFARWGNSLAVRIPVAYAKDLDVGDGDAADITVEQGRLVLTPQKAPVYRLDDLLVGITESNLHGEIGTGDTVGEEVG